MAALGVEGTSQWRARRIERRGFFKIKAGLIFSVGITYSYKPRMNVLITAPAHRSSRHYEVISILPSPWLTFAIQGSFNRCELRATVKVDA
jgi:hypothetical protein